MTSYDDIEHEGNVPATGALVRGEAQRKLGKATRVRQPDECERSGVAGAFRAQGFGLEQSKDVCAKKMAGHVHSESAMGRLLDRTSDGHSDWSPSKRKVTGHESDSGGDILRAAPIVIRGKVRRGCANAETTNIITHEIEKREQRREQAATGFERGRAFHSFFTEQPAIHKGTAHVKLPWQQLQMQQQQQMQQQMQQSPPEQQEHRQQQQMQQQQQQSQRTQEPLAPVQLRNSASTPVPSSSSSLSASLHPRFACPPGLDGLGQVDEFRARKAGKQQWAGAHHTTSLVDPRQASGADAGATSGGGALPMIQNPHQKIPDGSRGLRVVPGSQRQRDQIKESFETNPAPLRSGSTFVRSSSSIGNPEAAHSNLEFVSGTGGSTRVGPNLRHFQPSATAYPPLGAPSAFYRSSTPQLSAINAKNRRW